MSKTIKIILILAVVIAIIALSIFFIFFKKDTSLSVYKELSGVIDYKHRLNFDGGLYGLDEQGYGIDYKYDFEKNGFLEIDFLRRKLFEVDKDSKIEGGSVESGFLYYYGYSKYDEIIQDGLIYYSSYATLAKNAKSKDANLIKSEIERYTDDLIILCNKAEEVKAAQKKFGIDGTGISESVMRKEYEELRYCYRNYLYSGAKLVIDLKDFVVVNSFNNNFVFDTQSVLLDFACSTILSAMSAELDQEINYLNDASILVDKYYDYMENSEISYGYVTEIIFIEAYADMYYNNKHDLDTLYSFTSFQKQDLLEDNNNVSSELKIEYVEKAKIICGILK